MSDLEEKIRRTRRARAESVGRASPTEPGQTRTRPRFAAAAAAAVALVFIAGAIAAAMWVGTDGDRRAGSTVTSPTAVQGSDSAPASCPAADLSVTGLPWLPSDSEIPPPETIVEEGTTSLVWFEDADRRWDGRYVALQTSSEPPFGSDLEGFPTAKVRGQLGHIAWVGDPGVGELALTWQEGDASCSWHALRMSGAGLGEERAVSQLRRVASMLS